MLKIKNILAVLIVLMGIDLTAQTAIAHFSFDDCSVSDVQGNYINNIPTGNPSCECGPSQNAFQFNGLNDFVTLDPELKPVFTTDFTLSFYFWENAASNPFNIFAIKKDGCINVDSTMHVKYFPVNNTMEFNFTNNLGDFINVFTPLNRDVCWHHVVITKSGTSYSFFLDEVFIQTVDIGRNYIMADEASVFLGNTECLGGGGEQLMPGLVDEVQLFDRALSTQEIEALNLFPDKIITASTTIFEGESLNVITGGTCASNFSWSNASDLDDPMSLNPVITPDESTLYILDIDYGNCTTSDSILINVLADENLDCANLLLPKAFTPNGDGLNDSYGISNDFIVEELIYFEIYDRWGTKVFETNQLSSRWDGSYKSNELNPASYLYKVKYRCQSAEYLSVGNFSILR